MWYKGRSHHSLRELRDFIMIDKERLHKLQGVLSVAAEVLEEPERKPTFRIDHYQLDKDDLIGSYKKRFLERLKRLDEISKSISPDIEQYEYADDIIKRHYFSEMLQIRHGRSWLNDKIYLELLGKCTNGEVIAWRIMDEICMLCDYSFEELNIYKSSDGHWEGDLIFIPCKSIGDYLVLFLGEMTEEYRSSGYRNPML